MTQLWHQCPWKMVPSSDRGQAWCIGVHNQSSLGKLHGAWAALCMALNAHLNDLIAKHTSLKDFVWNSVQFNQSLGSAPHTDAETSRWALIGAIGSGECTFVSHGDGQTRFELSKNSVLFDPSAPHSTESREEAKTFVAFNSNRSVKGKWEELLQELGFVAPVGAPSPPAMSSADDSAGGDTEAHAGAAPEVAMAAAAADAPRGSLKFQPLARTNQRLGFAFTRKLSQEHLPKSSEPYYCKERAASNRWKSKRSATPEALTCYATKRSTCW